MIELTLLQFSVFFQVISRTDYGKNQEKKLKNNIFITLFSPSGLNFLTWEVNAWIGCLHMETRTYLGLLDQLMSYYCFINCSSISCLTVALINIVAALLVILVKEKSVETLAFVAGNSFIFRLIHSMQTACLLLSLICICRSFKIQSFHKTM